MKRIVSQLDKRWSSVEMVGSESRYDKYFSNMQIFEKYIYISEDVGVGSCLYKYIHAIYFTFTQRKNIGVMSLKIKEFALITIVFLSSMDGFYFYVMFMTTYLVEYYL